MQGLRQRSNIVLLHALMTNRQVWLRAGDGVSRLMWISYPLQNLMQSLSFYLARRKCPSMIKTK